MEGDTRRNTRSPAARLSGQTAERSDGKPAAAAAQGDPARGLQCRRKLQNPVPQSASTQSLCDTYPPSFLRQTSLSDQPVLPTEPPTPP